MLVAVPKYHLRKISYIRPNIYEVKLLYKMIEIKAVITDAHIIENVLPNKH